MDAYMKKPLPNAGHCVPQEFILNGGCCLNVWCENLSVISKIDLEGITGPPSHCLDDLEWDVSEEVFQGSTYSDSVALQWVEASILCSASKPCNELCFRQRTVCLAKLIGKSAMSKWGLLMLRWLDNAASGSVGPSCFAQKTSSPFCDVFVRGK